MEIYTLTLVNTAIGFDCLDVFPCLSLREAQRKMNERIDVMRSNGAELIEEGSTYAIVSIGGNRAYFDIFTNTITKKEIAIQKLTDYIILNYGDDIFGHDLLESFLDEYKDSVIISECLNGSIDDFMSDHIIGECLYENALEKLGGKVDMGEVIAEFLNENPQFIQLAKKYNNSSSTDYWMVGMCELCKGNEKMLAETRSAIDQNREDKVFFDLEAAKKQMCENHRVLSNQLTEREYISVCEQINGTPCTKTELPKCQTMVENLYLEFYIRAYNLAKARGINYLMSYPNVFEVREDHPVNNLGEYTCPQLVIVGDAVETAIAIDILEAH